MSSFYINKTKVEESAKKDMCAYSIKSWRIGNIFLIVLLRWLKLRLVEIYDIYDIRAKFHTNWNKLSEEPGGKSQNFDILQVASKVKFQPPSQTEFLYKSINEYHPNPTISLPTKRIPKRPQFTEKGWKKHPSWFHRYSFSENVH